jgi:hypothetical protein
MTYLLNTNIPTKSIFLDSVNATTVMSLNETTGTCYSDYVWYITPNIKCLPSHRMIISLVDAQFANVFPNIRLGVNDTFVYSIASGNTSTLTIPENQYTVETLASYISTLTGITVSINYTTYKLQFSTTGSSFRIYGTSTVGGLIGLTRNPDGSFVSAVSFANTLTMPSCFNLSGTPYVFVKFKNIPVESIDGGQTNSGTIARLDINAPYGHICFYKPAVVEQYLSDMKVIDMFRIYLTDHYNNPICLKGLNIQLTIRIQFIEAPQNDDLARGVIMQDLLAQHYLPYPVPMNNYLLNDETHKELGE